MDQWGKVLGETTLLTNIEKIEIIAAFFDGYTRQDLAFGYARAYRGLIGALPMGLESLERDLPFDFYQTLKKSKFATLAERPIDEFEGMFKNKLEEFVCPLTNIKF